MLSSQKTTSEPAQLDIPEPAEKARKNSSTTECTSDAKMFR